MNLIPIANYLEGEGLGAQGSTLFINFMPYECKKGILLRSPLVGIEIDPSLPGYYKGDVIVVVRAPEYVAALTLMEEVMRSMTFYDREIDDILVKRIYPSTLPVSFPVSDGQFYEVQVRFDVVYVGASYGYGA